MDGALNLNVHFHTLALDGVYDAKDGMRFRPLPLPEDDTVARVARSVARGIARLLERRGFGPDADPEEIDPISGDEPLLAALYSASVRGRVATGPRAGQAVLRFGDRVDVEQLPASLVTMTLTRSRFEGLAGRAMQIDGSALIMNVLAVRCGNGIVLGENLRWTDKETMVWDVESSADQYHVYQGSLDTLGYDNFGICADGTDSNLFDTELSVTAIPDPGEGWFWVITAESLAGSEGTLGFATCTERSNFIPCP